MPIIYQKWITRNDLTSNPDKVYVFGDNAMRMGMGGQAREMRGELNAIGVATKRRPDMSPHAFFQDGNAEDFDVLLRDLTRVEVELVHKKIVVAPSDGLGTGLSMLPDKAPRLYFLLWTGFDGFTKSYGGEPCPWPAPKI